MKEEDIKDKKKQPDCPLECSECKKDKVVYYTEIIEGKSVTVSMCADCPQLQKRLYGSSERTDTLIIEEDKTGLACGECGTTLQAIKMGSPLGCKVCYEVFSDVIIMEMLRSKSLVKKASTKKKGLLHVGYRPTEAQEISPSLQLIALNEALADTLKQENYEQAAWLRDQIKALTSEKEIKNDGQKK